MKKHLPASRQLWILMAAIFLVVSAIIRSYVLSIGWTTFNANITFIFCFIAIGIIYLTFHEFVMAVISPKIDKLFKKWGFKAKDNKKGIGIRDYAEVRDEKIRQQEEKAIALEHRVLKYISDTMAPYMDDKNLGKLIDKATDFIHATSVDFSESDAVTVSDKLTTSDLMHFGWNIAKPFRKPCGQTARFLKQLFPIPFRNTEVYTIEKKLRLNPRQGNIKINADVANYGIAVTKEPEVKNKTKHTRRSTESAMQAAMADMGIENPPDGFNLNDSLIED